MFAHCVRTGFWVGCLSAMVGTLGGFVGGFDGGPASILLMAGSLLAIASSIIGRLSGVDGFSGSPAGPLAVLLTIGATLLTPATALARVYTLSDYRPFIPTAAADIAAANPGDAMPMVIALPLFLLGLIVQFKIIAWVTEA